MKDLRTERVAHYVTQAAKHRLMARTDMANLIEIAAIYAVAWLFGWSVSPWSILAGLLASWAMHRGMAKLHMNVAKAIWTGEVKPHQPAAQPARHYV